MTIPQAIQKAVGEGYQIHEGEEALLDPLFWRALGVALGWHVGCSPRYIPYNQWWQRPWHRFIDHLAAGKSPASFFEQIASLSRGDCLYA